MTRACARLLVMGHQSSSRPAAEKPLPSPQNTLPSPHRCSLSNRFKKHLPSELPDRQHVVSIFRVMSRMPSELPEQGSGSGCQGPRHSAESIWRRGLVALRAATHGGANRTPVSVPGAGTRLCWQGPAPPRPVSLWAGGGALRLRRTPHWPVLLPPVDCSEDRGGLACSRLAWRGP